MIRYFAAFLLLSGFVAIAPASAAVNGTLQISVTEFGNQFPGPSGTAFSPPTMSSTSEVAFESSGQGGANDVNDTSDVYVRVIEAERTELVSVALEGNSGNNRSGWPSIDASGHRVAFQSLASDLVEGDGNATQDIFLRDRGAGTTERISLAADGGEADGPSFQPSISASGALVAFCSRATNLVDGDSNGIPDVFVRNLESSTTQHLVPPGAVDGEGCGRVAIAEDGQFVAFSYQAALGGPPQVFRANPETGEIVQLTTGNGPSGSAALAISADGRVVVFESAATDLVADDTNDFSDLFAWEEGGPITRLSVSADGAAGNSHSGTMGAGLSSDGRFVAFASSASNLVPGDGNRSFDVFRLDRQTGQITLASGGLNDKIGNSASYSPDISNDGSAVAFVSTASNLVQIDRNRHADVFVRGTTFLENGGGEEAPPVDAGADPEAPIVTTSDDDDLPQEVIFGGIAAGVFVLLLGAFFLLGRRGRA